MVLRGLGWYNIKVRVPREDKPRSQTHKNDIATNILEACSQNMQFIYVLPGWEESTTDSSVDAINRRNSLVVPCNKIHKSHFIEKVKSLGDTVIRDIFKTNSRLLYNF